MVTKDMYINEVLMMDRGVVPVFFQYGLHCLGCFMSAGETLEEAAMVHGIELDALLRDLNAYFMGSEVNA